MPELQIRREPPSSLAIARRRRSKEMLDRFRLWKSRLKLTEQARRDLKRLTTKDEACIDHRIKQVKGALTRRNRKVTANRLKQLVFTERNKNWTNLHTRLKKKLKRLQTSINPDLAPDTGGSEK